MSKQVRVALVLAAVGIVASVVAEWAVRHLTERGSRTTSKLRCRVGRATLASAKLAATPRFPRAHRVFRSSHQLQISNIYAFKYAA